MLCTIRWYGAQQQSSFTTTERKLRIPDSCPGNALGFRRASYNVLKHTYTQTHTHMSSTASETSRYNTNTFPEMANIPHGRPLFRNTRNTYPHKNNFFSKPKRRRTQYFQNVIRLWLFSRMYSCVQLCGLRDVVSTPHNPPTSGIQPASTLCDITETQTWFSSAGLFSRKVRRNCA